MAPITSLNLKKEIRKVRKLVKKCHNKNLVNEYEVFHIWNDGRITRTKGRQLYGGRTIFKTHIQLVDEHPFGKFPCRTRCFMGDDKNASFAIVTEKDAVNIRNEMKFALEINDDVPNDFKKDWFFEDHGITSDEYSLNKCLVDVIKLRQNK